MSSKIIFQDLQTIPYLKAWQYQQVLFDKLLENKIQNRTYVPENYVLFCEHQHVYTLGKNGKRDNLLLDEQQLKAKNIDFFLINRGGDITYHGLGQLVVYPILDLESFGFGLREYIFRLEEVVIQLLKTLDIEASRLENAAGVWTDSKHKICAIGVRASRMITMHGLALNINTDLQYFDYINPCGFTDKKIISIEKILHQNIDTLLVKDIFKEKFLEIFSQK